MSLQWANEQVSKYHFLLCMLFDLPCSCGLFFKIAHFSLKTRYTYDMIFFHTKHFLTFIHLSHIDFVANWCQELSHCFAKAVFVLYFFEHIKQDFLLKNVTFGFSLKSSLTEFGCSFLSESCKATIFSIDSWYGLLFGWSRSNSFPLLWCWICKLKELCFENILVQMGQR